VDVLRKEGFQVIPAATNALAARIGAVEELLMGQIDGKARITFSPTCSQVIQALGGAYRYRTKTNKETESVPEKNRASHIMDALQYFCLHVEGAIGVRPRSKVRDVQTVPYAWT